MGIRPNYDKNKVANLYIKLIDIEKKCDQLNSDYGWIKEYCIFCKSNEYDGLVGIKHKKGCAILQLRSKLKDLIEEMDK